VPFQNLKDLAIAALDISSAKDFLSVKSLLVEALLVLSTRTPSFIEDTADVLASMVITAYVIAATAPVGEALNLLRATFPQFTFNQIQEIARIAS
jgi:hypothetical protein